MVSCPWLQAADDGRPQNAGTPSKTAIGALRGALFGLRLPEGAMRRSCLARLAGVRRAGGLFLLAGVSALFPLAGCTTVQEWMQGPYDLELVAFQMDKVVSVFLIVTDEANLEGLDDEDRIADVVAPSKQSSAVTFVQFRAEKRNGRWDFEELSAAATDPNIEYEADEDDPRVVFEIDRDLLESQPNLAVVVVVNYGLDGWRAKRIEASELRRSDGARIEVDRSAVRKKAL